MQEVVLAALLHDIEEFAKRSGSAGDQWALGSDFCRSYLPDRLQCVADLIAMQADSSVLSQTRNEQLKASILADWLSSGEPVGKGETDETNTDYAEKFPADESLITVLFKR